MISSPPDHYRQTRALWALAFFFTLFMIAVVVVYVRGSFWGKEFPLNSFLPAAQTRFGDYFGNHDHWRRLRFNDISYQAAYFPFTYLIIDLFTSYLTSAYVSLFVFFASVIVGTGLGLVALGKSYSAPPVVIAVAGIIVVGSYPFLIMLHTGNIEGWTFVFILLAVLFKERGETSKSVVFLALATAMKVFPIVFLPFVLAGGKGRQKRREIAQFVAIGLGSSIIALITQPHGLTDGFGVIKRMNESQKMYRELMVTGEPGINFGHSFLNGFHAVFGSELLPSSTFWIVTTLLLLSVTALLVLFTKEQKSWTLLALCGSLGCLLAPTSTDYKLLYILPAVIAGLLTPERLNTANQLLFMILIFVISPKPYWVLKASPYFNAGVWLTPIVLIVIIAFAAYSLIKERIQPNE